MVEIKDIVEYMVKVIDQHEDHTGICVSTLAYDAAEHFNELTNGLIPDRFFQIALNVIYR